LLLQNKPTIILTGATGFLGSHLMASMLTSGYRMIITGRSTKEEALGERIIRLLKWFGIENRLGQTELVEIDFLKPLLGMRENEYNDLCRKKAHIIHCASDTSFSERKRENVLRSNVKSLDGILKFASDSKAGFFHYISTAYVAGKDVKICRECLPLSSDFQNVYEESKAQAENIISSYCHRNSIPYTIIRPSVVYGDSRSGRSLKFNALYFPIQSARYLQDIYLNDILTGDGKKSKELGIHIDPDGNLFMPLKICLPQKGSLNIIPVDYFTDTTIKIIESATPGGIFHLTNSSPTYLDTIAVYNEKLMKVKGIEIIYGMPEPGTRNPAEELFDRFMEPYRFYLSDSRIFDRTNTDLITGNAQPPEFSFEIFKKCMEYAISVNWGKSIS
jgi:nucleoside-diphosphate-sugar epimerase